MQIQISWFLQKPTDLDLHGLLRQSMSSLAREGLSIYEDCFKHWFVMRLTIMLMLQDYGSSTDTTASLSGHLVWKSENHSNMKGIMLAQVEVPLQGHHSQFRHVDRQNRSSELALVYQILKNFDTRLKHKISQFVTLGCGYCSIKF